MADADKEKAAKVAAARKKVLGLYDALAPLADISPSMSS